MPTPDEFKDLLEIQSLDKYIQAQEQEIEQEKGRISFLERQKADKELLAQDLFNQISDLKEQVTLNEKSLFELERKLTNSNDQLMQARDQKEQSSLEENISTLIPLIDQNQESILQWLEDIEGKEQEIFWFLFST